MTYANPVKPELKEPGSTRKVGTVATRHPVNLDALLRFNPFLRDNPQLLKRFLQGTRDPDAEDGK
jgi:hypothetical protein